MSISIRLNIYILDSFLITFNLKLFACLFVLCLFFFVAQVHHESFIERSFA
jgi:hypothetical protein